MVLQGTLKFEHFDYESAFLLFEVRSAVIGQKLQDVISHIANITHASCDSFIAPIVMLAFCKQNSEF